MMVSIAQRLQWIWVSTLAAVALAGCGGDGGGGTTPPPPDPPPPPPVACEPIIDSSGTPVPCSDALWVGGGDGAGAAGADGTAGDGEPLVGATIRLTDATGRTATAVTNALGYYRMNVTGMTAPFTLMLTTADGKPYHHGYTLATPKARGFITINISGLTDKLCSDMAVLAGKSGAGELTPALLAANPSAASAAIRNLATTLKSQIEAAGLSTSSFDPVTTFFRPDRTGLDLVLETTAVYIDSSGATQVVPKPQTACTLPSDWRVGSNRCLPDVHPGYLASGSTIKLSDNAGALVGSSEYACSDRVLTPIGTPTCNAPPAQLPCSAPSSSWTVGSASCQSDTTPTTLESGAQVTLSDTVGSTTGTIGWSCSNGALSPVGSATCNLAAGKCAAPASTWSLGEASCQSDTTPTELSFGQTVTLTDSIGPTTGTATWNCNSGTLVPVTIPFCATAPEPACDAPDPNWTVGSSTCSADLLPTSVASGSSVKLTDSGSPTTGDITYSCSSGKLSVSGTPACVTEVSDDCSTAELAANGWSISRSTCFADALPAKVSNGVTIVVSDTVAPATGSATFRCTAGALVRQAGATCTEPSP